MAEVIGLVAWLVFTGWCIARSLPDWEWPELGGVDDVRR